MVGVCGIRWRGRLRMLPEQAVQAVVKNSAAIAAAAMANGAVETPEAGAVAGTLVVGVDVGTTTNRRRRSAGATCYSGWLRRPQSSAASAGLWSPVRIARRRRGRGGGLAGPISRSAVAGCIGERWS